MKICKVIAKISLFTLIVCGGVLNAQSGFSQNSPSEPAFSLSIKAFNPEIAVGSGITIAITVTIVSQDPIRLVFGRYGNIAAGYEYLVRDGNGKTPVKVDHSGSKRPIRAPGSSVKGVIQPGKSVEEATTLSDIYQFDHPGKYTIQVSRKEQGMPVVRSNSITVTVVQKPDAQSAGSK